MVRETGAILDDGTVVVLAPDPVLVTITSVNAHRIYAWPEEWHQCEWPQLRVAIVPVTEQWSSVSLTGPHACAILGKLSSNFDLTASAYPHLTLREGKLLGLPARLYRVSLTGELT